MVKNFLSLAELLLFERTIYNVMTHTFEKQPRERKKVQLDTSIRQYSNLVPTASGKEINFNSARY